MASLFTRDVQVAVLASGSAGNCTYVGDGHGGVLVDCGVSTRQVLKRMEEIGLGDAPIDGVLVTHEHTDHVGAARVLCKKLRDRQGKRIGFYMTAGTRAGLRPQCIPDAVEIIQAGVPFALRHFLVDPVPVPHDTRDPVAYRVALGGRWVGVMTDMGRATALLRQKLQDLSIAVLEFNHDVDMLLDGPYPWPLKQRIRSSHGHLSNRQAAELLHDGAGDELAHVVLAHLSEKNNCPQRALETAAEVLRKRGLEGQVGLHLGRQDVPISPVAVRAHDW